MSVVLNRFFFLEDIRQKVKALYWVVDRSCSQFLAPGMSLHHRSFKVYERKSRVWWQSGRYRLVWHNHRNDIPAQLSPAIHLKQIVRSFPHSGGGDYADLTRGIISLRAVSKAAFPANPGREREYSPWAHIFAAGDPDSGSCGAGRR